MSMWSQRRKSDSDSESAFSLKNFETDLRATVSEVYYWLTRCTLLIVVYNKRVT